MRHKPDGIFLSNGPGDPAATGKYAVPTIRGLMDTGVPMFGICLGHQLMALALGAETEKMPRGHRGANHPVKDLATGKVEITSQNHGFVVKPESLPDTVEVTHVSLFDGTNEGLKVKDKPIFSVQYHPEASPGPEDSHYLFHRFVDLIDSKRRREERRRIVGRHAAQSSTLLPYRMLRSWPNNVSSRTDRTEEARLHLNLDASRSVDERSKRSLDIDPRQ